VLAWCFLTSLCLEVFTARSCNKVICSATSMGCGSSRKGVVLPETACRNPLSQLHP
jgi:hypothetical protein